MITDKSSCGIGNGSRNHGISYMMHHIFDWQIDQIGIRSVFNDFFIDWHVVLIILNPKSSTLIPDSFNRNIRSAPGLSKTENDIRMMLSYHLDDCVC
jgi:hypothetical protein